MKTSDPKGLPTAIADTRSLLRELEELGKRLKPVDERQGAAKANELVINGK